MSFSVFLLQKCCEHQPLLRGGTEGKSTTEAPVGTVNKKPATSKPKSEAQGKMNSERDM